MAAPPRPRRSSPGSSSGCARKATRSPTRPLSKVRLRTRTHTPLGEVMHTLIHLHRDRTLVALALMAAQAFFYNAIFFTYALVLTTFYGIPQPACRLVHPAVRGRQRARAAAARAAVRHHRPAADDRLHLPDVGAAAGADRLAVRARDAQRARADVRLERDLLLRLGGGKLGLSHGERDLSAGNPRARDRGCSMRSAPASAAWPGRCCSAR